MMLAEWREAFGAHNPNHLHTAVSQAMQACKFWPSIAEIMEPLRSIRREAVATLETISGSGRWVADGSKQDFCRDGRTEAEEIAHRKAMCAKWRDDAAALKTPNETGI